MSTLELAAGEIAEALGLVGALEGALVIGDRAGALHALEMLRRMFSVWGGRAARAEAC